MPAHITKPYVEKWLVPLALIAFGIAAIWLAANFDRMPPILKRGMQPADFPQLVAILIVALSALMLWRDPVLVTEPMRLKTVGTLALMGLFVGLTAIDLFLAIAVFGVLLSYYWGERRKLVLSVIGLVVPVVIFFVFDQVFEIRFPRGLLTSIWYG